MLQERFVFAIDEAPFLPSREQRLIRVSDESVSLCPVLAGTDAGGFVAQCFFILIRYDVTVFKSQIPPNDDATVVELKSLGRMDTSNLIKGIRGNCEQGI